MCIESIVNLLKSLRMRIVLWTIHSLLSIKAARPHKIHYHNSQLSMTETNKKETEMDSLSEIQITEGGN